jgi:membrane-bound lytic murein transglycosylase D
MIRSAHLLLVLCAAAVLASPRPASAQRFHAALDPTHFPVPPTLVTNVEFWEAIFARHPSTQTVIHDNRHLDVVFGVVDVADLVRAGASPAALERTMETRVRNEIETYQRILRRLAGDTRAQATPEELARVRALYAASARGASDMDAAADRVRGQLGLRDRFAEAVAVSGMFMDDIEATMRRHGVPVEVSRLPFVESMFNYRARSKVGASGAWQFTPSTGRMYLQMDTAVDARSDVWLAADGAARMLAGNFQRVQSWPLALTGYNHGIAGMQRAVRALGTNDISALVDGYSSPTFGFASRNFYAEFVAAVVVYADRARHFPGVEPMPPVRFDEYAPGRFVSMLDLAHLTGTDVALMTELNPALHADVSSGQLLVPPTYPLRLPAGTRAAFERAFAMLPEARKPERQITVRYTVARGDTLGAVARRFGTSVAALQQSNGLGRSTLIRVGQSLEVRAGGAAWTPLVWSPVAGPATASDGVHVVRSGETLTTIAARYGLYVAALVGANALRSADLIRVGMRLAIPGRAE